MTHDGALPGFNCSITRYVDLRATIILSNIDYLQRKLDRGLEAILFGRPYTMPQRRHIIDPDPSVHERYVGDYLDQKGDTIHITLEIYGLEVAKPGQYSASMYPESENTFYVPLADGTARFETDSDGEVRFSIVDTLGKVHVRATKIEM